MSKITTAVGTGLRKGDRITIAGMYKPDRRWWPRLKAWVLRCPPPMSDELVVFMVSGEVTSHEFPFVAVGSGK